MGTSIRCTLTAELVFHNLAGRQVELIQQHSLRIDVEVLECLLKHATPVRMRCDLLDVTFEGVDDRLGRFEGDQTLRSGISESTVQ